MYRENPCVIETESNHFQSTSFVFFFRRHSPSPSPSPATTCTQYARVTGNIHYSFFVSLHLPMDTEYHKILFEILSHQIMSWGNKTGKRRRGKNAEPKNNGHRATESNKLLGNDAHLVPYVKLVHNDKLFIKSGVEVMFSRWSCFFFIIIWKDWGWQTQVCLRGTRNWKISTSSWN